MEKPPTTTTSRLSFRAPFFLPSPVRYKLDVVNCMDTFLIFLRVLDVWILAPLGIQSGLRLTSGFRIIRMGPAVKHWQATKELRELWIVIGAVADTVRRLGGFGSVGGAW